MNEKKPMPMFGCLMSYVISYILIHMSVSVWDTADECIWGIVPVLLYTIWLLLDTRGEKREPSHGLWLVGMWLTVFVWERASGIFPTYGWNIWGESGFVLLFMPLFVVLWTLNVCGGAFGGNFFFLDLLNGFCVLPFKNFSQRIRAWVSRIASLVARHDEKSRSRAGFALLTVIIALVFFAVALALLNNADYAFSLVLRRIFGAIQFDTDDVCSVFLEFLFSLPIGAYLYGLVRGAQKQETEKKLSGIASFMEKIRRLPRGVWCAVLLCFSALYFLFIGFETMELARTIETRLAPVQYTMASFARQGFFEMCAVMALNFALLFVAERTAERPISATRMGRIAVTLVLSASMLFAVSALIKLGLYFAAFGVTPLRLQGAWGISVLIAGCVCKFINLYTGKKTLRYWTYYTALSLYVTFFL